MTDKELKKLNRRDLLVLLLEYSEQNDKLKTDLKALQSKLEEQRAVIKDNDSLVEELEDCRMEIEELREQHDRDVKLINDRTIALKKAGSIAEASLALNGVFESAQAASDQYLDNIKHRFKQVEKFCKQREKDSQEKADQMIRDAAKEGADIIRDAKKQRSAILKGIERFVQENVAAMQDSSSDTDEEEVSESSEVREKILDELTAANW